MMVWKFETREQVLDFVGKNFGVVKGLPKEAFLDWVESIIETGVVEGEDDGYKRAMVIESGIEAGGLEDERESIRESAYDDGYSDGHSDGHAEGVDEGREEGYEDATAELEEKYNEGYKHGVDSVTKS